MWCLIRLQVRVQLWPLPKKWVADTSALRSTRTTAAWRGGVSNNKQRNKKQGFSDQSVGGAFFFCSRWVPPAPKKTEHTSTRSAASATLKQKSDPQVRVLPTLRNPKQNP